MLSGADLIVKEVADSKVMIELWKSYQNKFDYAVDILWENVMESVKSLIGAVK